MGEIRDKLVLDSSQAEAAIDRVVRAAAKLRAAGGDSVKDFKKGLRSAGDVAADLSKEIESLNRRAVLDRAKAQSDDYRAALKRAAAAQKQLSDATRPADQNTRSLGESMFTTGNQALELAQKGIQAVRVIREIALAGADASRVTAQFRGDLEALRAASGGAIDDTTLQRLDIMARRVGMSNDAIEALTRLATKFARESGQEMTEVFGQMMDASPEQLEKWGVLTSELSQKLQGLDSVQQKNLLRMELVREGHKLTNEQIAEQTHQVESLSAQWDNLVSSMQVGVATILDSNGARDAVTYLKDAFTGLGSILGTVGEAWVTVTDAMTGASAIFGQLPGEISLMSVAVDAAVGPVLQLAHAWDQAGNAASTAATDAVFAMAATAEDEDDVAAAEARVKRVQEMARRRDEDTRRRTEERRKQREAAARGQQLLFSGAKGLNNFVGGINPFDGGDGWTSTDKPRGRRRGPSGTNIGGTLSGLAGFGGDLQLGIRSQQLGAAGIGSADDALAALTSAFAANDSDTNIGGNLVGLATTSLSDVEELFGQTADTIVEKWNARLEDLRLESLRNLALDTTQAVSNAFLSTFESIVAGGDSFRANMMGILGELWGQLSAGFMAWAVAEGNLLAGNPFGAIAAATALGVIGSVISGIGSRGSGGSSKGTSAQRFNERERERQEQKPETKMTVELVGIPVPDETARQLAGALERNMQLRGAA